MPTKSLRASFVTRPLPTWHSLRRTLVAVLVVLGSAPFPRPSLAQTDTGAQWLADLATLSPDQTGSQPIDAFPNVIRLPRRDMALFAGLDLGRAELGVAGIASSDLEYEVWLGSTPTNSVPAPTNEYIYIRGAAGRDNYSIDADAADLAGAFSCLVTGVNYCSVYTVRGQVRPTREAFSHLVSAAGHPGAVIDEVQGATPTKSWRVAWYVPDNDVSYQLTVSGTRAASLKTVAQPTSANPNAMGPDNAAVAQTLLDLTDTFIGVSGGQVVDEPPVSGDPTAALVASQPTSSAPNARATPATIDWASVLRAQTDPRARSTPCQFPNPRAPSRNICVPGGYAALDLISIGDIVGDGGTEAVIPIDSGGSIGQIGSLIFRVAPTPQLIVADGPGGGVSIDPDAHLLVTLGPDPNTMCSTATCFEGMLKTTYKLVGNALVKQAACTYVPDPGDLRKAQGECTPFQQ